MNVYEWADNEVNACPTYQSGFTHLLSAGPYRLPSTVIRLYQARHPLIRSFQKTALDIFRAALSEKTPPMKYAGADWTLNFGSKAVYRLSNMSSDACLEFLEQCLGQYERGQIWLLQQEEAHDDDVTYLTRDSAVHTERLRARFSGFYGPSGCLGVLAMHGHHNKVHGREDTIFSYVLADVDT
ncbi:MAG: hypothetical protein ACM30E_03475 [Nitrososphaerales archaeon]